MNYTNAQIAEQIAKTIKDSQKTDQSSFANGVMTYNGKEYIIPTDNSRKRYTYLINR